MATAQTKAGVPADDAQVIYRQIRSTQRYVKWIELGSSLMVLFTILVGYLFVMALVDHWVVSLGTIGRTLAFLILVSGLVAYFALIVTPYLLRPINPLYAAQTIERSTPSLKNSLINFLFLRNRPTGVHQVVLDAVQKRAAADVGSIKVESTVDWTRIWRVAYLLVGVVVVGVLYTMLSPKDPLQSVYRIALPWANIDRPTRVQIVEVKPGDITIVQGEDVEITARVRPQVGASILVSAKNGSFVDRPVAMSDKSGLAVAELTNVQEPLFYRIKAGDALSPEYQIRVRVAPIIEVDRIEYEYPPYTGRQKVVLEARGDIRALEGTRVTIHAKTNEAIRSAYMELFSGQKIDKEVMTFAEKSAVARLTLQMVSRDNQKTFQPKYDKYRLRFKSLHGLSDGNLDYRIDVIRDKAPVIELLDPKSQNIEVPEDGEQLIEVRAVDSDFGLTQIKLVAQAGDMTVLDRVLFEDTQGQLGQIIRTFKFSPTKLKLVAGDRVQLVARAADNRTHPISRSAAPNVSQTNTYTITITAPKNRQQGNNAQQQLNNNPGQPIDPQQGSKKPQQPNANPQQNGSKQQNQKQQPQQKKNEEPQAGKKQQQEGGSGAGGAGGKPQQNKDQTGQQGGKGGQSDSQTKQQQNPNQQGGGAGKSGDNSKQNQGGQGARQSQGGQQNEKKDGNQQKSGGGERSPSGANKQNNKQQSGTGSGGQKKESGSESQPPQDEHIGDKLERILKHRKQQGQDQQGNKNQGAGKDDQGQPAGRRRGKDGGGKQDNGNGTSRLTDPMGRKKPEQSQSADGKGNNKKSQAEESEPGRNQTLKSGKKGPQGGSQKQPGTKGESENKGTGRKQQTDTGNSGSPMGKRQDAKDKANKGARKGEQKKKAGGGNPSQPGAGEKSKQEEGAGGTDRDLIDKKKKLRPDNKGGDRKQQQSALHKNEKKTSDSKSDSSGDRAGGGGKSKGQNANNAGNDSAGGNRSSDRGAGKSPETGQGELSQQRGKQQAASSKTGQKGSQQGKGTYSKQGKKGQKSNNRKSSSRSPNQKLGSGGSPKGGGKAADRPPEKFANRPKEPVQQSRENVEFAKQQTNLALEHLKKQLNNPQALKDMKLSKNEARRILDYFSKLKSQASSKTGKNRLNDVFRSLGLRPGGFQRRAGASRSDNSRGNVQDGRSGGPPSSYRELWNAARTRTK